MQELPGSEMVDSLTVPTSMAAKLANIFATPAEVFDEIKDTPVRSLHWFIPVVLTIAVAITSILVLLSQPNLVQQIRESQSREFEKQVEAGKMTRIQANQAEAFMENMGPKMFKIIAIVATVVSSFAVPFWWGFVVWLVAGSFFRQKISYMKAVECTGLASMLYALSFLLNSLLGLVLGRLYTTPSLGLLVHDFDVSNKIHLALASVNVVYLWFAVILGIGLSRLAKVPASRAVIAILVVWIGLRAIFIPLRLGQLFM